MSERAAATKAKTRAYADADRVRKTVIPDELAELTGWHRDYARAALRDALNLEVVKARRASGTDVWAQDHGRVGQVLGGPACSGRQAAGTDARGPGAPSCAVMVNLT